jgi:hypothetical protein
MIEVTRRQLVGRAVAAGAAASFVGAADAAAAAKATDPQVLEEPLGVEHLLVVAYTQVVAAPVLSSTARGALRTLLTQELEHARTLERAVVRLGGAAPTTLPSLATAQSELEHYHVPWNLSRLRSERACLKLLIDLESVAENAYFKAIGMLQDPAVLRTCVSIMGCEAQHWSVLSGILNDGQASKAVPYPFVGGPG